MEVHRMSSNRNGEYRSEIAEELEARSSSARVTPDDHIPTFIPTGPAPGAGSGQRFRVPFVRKMNWRGLIRSFKKWIQNPGNVPLFIWSVFVVAGLILLALVMFGALDDAIPNSTRRKKWIEVINQILNALFMILCLYQHPNIFYHSVLLLRWNSSDRVKMRKSYCKDGARRPHERAHMTFVVLLLHITCASEYVFSGLFWGYSRTTRPDWAMDATIAVGIIAPVVAGVYVSKSPLGRRYDTETGEESQHQATPAAIPEESEVKRPNRRVVVTNPQWIGGLFDCWDDLTVAFYSFFCTFCVFGWNAERLGFGNMYVHISIFILLCIAPFLVFGAAALRIDNDTIPYIVAITGIVLCIFGLLYGGYWRLRMRKRFKLPGNPCCCGYPSVTDCMAWQFCWSCALAQEVRTANFYDIEADSFYRIVTPEDGRQVLHPLPREGGSGIEMSTDSTSRSQSCPPKIGPTDVLNLMDTLDGFPINMERARTYVESHVMEPPLPSLIQLQDSYP